jgi:type I restriction-modification system DNA methylase subunit
MVHHHASSVRPIWFRQANWTRRFAGQAFGEASACHAWLAPSRRKVQLPSVHPFGGQTKIEPTQRTEAKPDEIRAHGHVLTPGRYVGAEEAEDDGEPFEQKMKRLTAKLEKAIW